MRTLELLSPAKDAATALTAIRHGADAVYIGGPDFGARQAAGNTVEDIRQVVEYAHRYYARVFVTLNTILYDEELSQAEQLIRELYHIGVDALIVQDTGILQLDLPPIALHASTQMHNYDPERIRFLDRLGFQRIVLARELSLEQIREIRREVKAELEYFVHGALCVSLSGQCYISHYLSGRSANRGACMQACRMKWDVTDATGKVLLKDKYPLSLRDLNLSSRLPELIDAGIDSFKIEGRLKDAAYVANVTACYSDNLNRIIAGREELSRASSGISVPGFVPDPEKSFNRGFTTYFLDGRQPGLVNRDTPKSMGKRVGEVIRTQGNRLYAALTDKLHNGDGLCYIESGELKGCRINQVEEGFVVCGEKIAIPPGTPLYRNYDRIFTGEVEKGNNVRNIRVHLDVFTDNGRMTISAEDEDGVMVTSEPAGPFEPATHPEQKKRMEQQLRKSGGSGFSIEAVNFYGEPVLFVPAAELNQIRRDVLSRLTGEREKERLRWTQQPLKQDSPYPLEADWRLNISNRLAARFYQQHGVEQPPAGFEKSDIRTHNPLMRSRYCLLYELGLCLRTAPANARVKLPLFLKNDAGQFRLDFDCKNCFMEVCSF